MKKRKKNQDQYKKQRTRKHFKGFFFLISKIRFMILHMNTGFENKILI